MHARAYAKVNLGLRVADPGADGYHPLSGIFQSVDWADGLWLDEASDDEMAGDGGPVPDGDDNLAWRALAAVRAAAGGGRPVRLTLRKRIPVAAGLGGGSADAAAALALAGRRFGIAHGDLVPLAATLGSDVPFCLTGGTAAVTGRGDRVHRRDPATGFAVALVVPPFELSTPAVYREWDRLGGPEGPAIGAGGLPPALRGDAPLVNDLYPAAVSLVPDLDGWRRELADRWGTAVLMSGSGPTLYGFFIDADEAASALDQVPRGARTTRAASPIPFGWLIDDGGTVVTPPRRTVASFTASSAATDPLLVERLLAAPVE
jgi:4-diphosphocytidyl-2-C-methyl-D-erythritol kinase